MQRQRAQRWQAEPVDVRKAVTLLPAAAGALHLRLANDIAAVAAALPALQAFAAGHGLAPKLANRLEVVFEEVTTNAIRHGFTPGSGQSIAVLATLAGSGVQLVFEDDGPLFDPLSRPQPLPLDDLASAPEGGLGIALVRRLASRISHEQPCRQSGLNNRLIVELAPT